MAQVAETSTSKGHLVTLTMLAWGHTKSACSVVAKILRSRPISVTMFVALPFVEKVAHTLDGLFLPGVESEDQLRKLIRIVGVECGPSPLDSTLLIDNFLLEYPKLLNNEPTLDDKFNPGIPKLIILDLPLYSVMTGVRAISGRSVPIYTLQSAVVAACLLFCGPESVGGPGDLHAKFEKITATDKATRDAEIEKIFRRMDGKLLKISGLPPMYDHEHQPQGSILPVSAAGIQEYIHRFVNECDGIVMSSTPILEKEALETFKRWFGDRPIINMGPFDFPVIDESGRLQTSKESAGVNEVMTFLSTALQKHGPKSVIYFSFGSAFWSTEPEKIWTILDVFIQRDIPFIFSHASPFAVVPDEIEAKITNSGLGYSTTWAPQTDILRHEALGWFITHGGQNSVTEALSFGVPLICWPFDADQPANAAYISAVYNVGYELFEVRTGPGLKPIHRLKDWTPTGTLEAVRREFNEVLTKARGADGEEKRKNAQRIQKALAKSWAKDGESWEEVKKISDMFE